MKRLLIVAGLILANISFAVRPSFDSAQVFGRQLQLDFAAKHAQAIIDRLDETSLKRRVFSAYAADPAADDSLAKLWSNSIFPGVLNEIRALDPYSALSVTRTMLVDGGRAIECLLLTEKGAFRMLTMRLNQGADGVVRIEDFSFLGSALGMTQKIRHLFLIMGASSTAMLGEEEIQLELASRTDHATVNFAIDAMAKNNVEQAFRAWTTLSADLKATRIWQDVRNTLALRGSKGALGQLVTEFQEGKRVDPYLRYFFAVSAKDKAAQLLAVNDLLAENSEATFFRIVKADLLVTNHRPAEALKLAQDVYELTPLAVGAYWVAISAASSLNQPDAAIEALNRWSAITPVAEIDARLAREDSYAKFRASEPYRGWLRANTPTAAVTASPL